MREIPNSNLLISCHHTNYVKSANFEVFDITRPSNPKKLYSFQEISGKTLGMMPVNPNCAYTAGCQGMLDQVPSRTMRKGDYSR